MGDRVAAGEGRRFTASGRVKLSVESITMSGQKKLFHEPMNVKIASAARAGRAIGTTTCQNACRSVMPSIRAASIRLSGTVAIDCFM